MYAVIETGGKQFRVSPGDTIEVDKLAGDVGSQVELGKVLAVGHEGSLSVGDAVSGARVTGTITGHDRSAKVIVFKFKRKKQYKKTIGHRQHFTAVKIDGIQS